jgi:quercetin dioxygenase-like cupin family protein
VCHIYEDADGVSHFRDFKVELHNQGDIGSLSKQFGATGVSFRYTPGTYNFDWHPAPRRQFVINLQGEVQIEVGSGEIRKLEQGQILFVEDIKGKGHISRAVNSQPRYSLFIPVSDDVTFF